MAGLIMMGLIVLTILTLIIMLITKQGKKRILKTLGGFIVVIGVFHLYVDHTCGPNSTDVKIMTPQAEAISNYILKNGIPNSLYEIPDLPYKFERCKRTLLYGKYRKEGYVERYYEDANQTNAKGELLEETCTFKQDDRKYDVNIQFTAMYTDDYIQKPNLNKNLLNSEILRKGSGKLVFYNKKTETGMSYNYKFTNKIKMWVYDYFYVRGKKNNPKIYSTKDDGVCNPLRM